MKFTLTWIGWQAVICYLLFTPGEEGDPFLFEGEDKLFHIGLFAIVTVFALLAFRGEWRLGWRATYGFTLASGIVFALITEGVQHFLPTRSGDVLDLLADIVGILVMILFWQVLEKRNQTLPN